MTTLTPRRAFGRQISTNTPIPRSNTPGNLADDGTPGSKFVKSASKSAAKSGTKSGAKSSSKIAVPGSANKAGNAENLLLQLIGAASSTQKPTSARQQKRKLVQQQDFAFTLNRTNGSSTSFSAFSSTEATTRTAQHVFRVASGPGFKGFRRPRTHSSDAILPANREATSNTRPQMANLLKQRLANSSRPPHSSGNNEVLLPYPPGFTPPIAKRTRCNSSGNDNDDNNRQDNFNFGLPDAPIAATATPTVSMAALHIGTPEPDDIHLVQHLRSRMAAKHGLPMPMSSMAMPAIPAPHRTAAEVSLSHVQRYQKFKEKEAMRQKLAISKAEAIAKAKAIAKAEAVAKALKSPQQTTSNVFIGTPEADDAIVEAVKRGKSLSRVLQHKGLAAHRAAHSGFRARVHHKAIAAAQKACCADTCDSKENIAPGQSSAPQIRRQPFAPVNSLQSRSVSSASSCSSAVLVCNVTTRTAFAETVVSDVDNEDEWVSVVDSECEEVEDDAPQTVSMSHSITASEETFSETSVATGGVEWINYTMAMTVLVGCIALAYMII